MLLGPLGLVFLLVLVDYGAWDWAIASDQGTVALVAGLAMAPLMVALAWYASLALSAVVRAGTRRAQSAFRLRFPGAEQRERTAATPELGDHAEPVPERLAA
jgi:hypothetical protein